MQNTITIKCTSQQINKKLLKDADKWELKYRVLTKDVFGSNSLHLKITDTVLDIYTKS